MQHEPIIPPVTAPDTERMRQKLSAGRRPYVTLKAAVSLDGRIATRAGESQWITGEPARAYAHRLRAAHDAVLVGRGTVEADDPQLTVRLPDVSALPARIVLDSRCLTPPGAKCLVGDGARRIVVTGSAASPRDIASLEGAGVEVIRCHTERPEPEEFLPALRVGGIDSVLVEGGGEVHASLIAQGEPDELFLIMAGIVIGGMDAPGWCASLGIDRLQDAPRLVLRPPFIVGEDVVIHGVFNQPAGSGP